VSDKEVCARCGRIHVTTWGTPACSGHLTSDPKTPCTKSPKRGMTVCRTHGGALKKSQAAAQSRIAMMDAM
jgi:hypothetical protein